MLAMKRRTYEFYEIRTNIGKDDERLLATHMTTRDQADTKLHGCATVLFDHEDVFLVRVSVVDAYKRETSQ